MRKTITEGPVLLQTQTQKEWKLPVKFGYYLWNLGWLLFGCVILGLGSLLLSAANFGMEVFYGYFDAPMILFMNILLPYAVCLLIYLLSGRPWLSYLLTVVLCLGLSVGNYFLIQIRNDPLQLVDVLCLAEALDISAKQHYEWHVGFELIVSVGGCAAACVLIALLAHWKPRIKNRLGLLIVTGAVLMAAFFGVRSDRVCAWMKNYSHINTWSATQIYISRGMLYSFSRSALNVINSAPEGYQEKTAKAILDGYTQTDIPADEKVNVFVIMRESYCDLSILESKEGAIDFSCYDAYHELAAESCTGALITNGFGGNTKDAERCFLTGSYSPIDYRKPANSYVWYLREQGYTVEGAHPFNGWFYNRVNVNRYLGFETYNFREEVFNDLVGEETVADDDVLYDVIWQMFEESDASKPYFNFSVTYEGHGPYNYRKNNYGTSFVKTDADTADGYAMENYLGCVQKRDAELMELVEKMRASDRPIVLMIYGDHKATLGSDINNYTTAAYEAFGMDMNIESEQGFIDYYGTQYLIWANDAAKAQLGIDLAGKTGPMISPCYLMNVLFNTLEWDCGSSYLQAMNDYMAEFPIVSRKGRVSIDGILQQSIPAEYAEDYYKLLYIDYYETHESKQQ